MGKDLAEGGYVQKYASARSLSKMKLVVAVRELMLSFTQQSLVHENA